MKARSVALAPWLLMLLACLGATQLRAQTTAPPLITLPTGTYTMPTSTTITDSTAGASILWCWVTSGTCTPATAYTPSIYVDPPTTVTVCANATAPGYSVSSTVCHAYTNGGSQTTANPVITLPTGTYAMPTSTTITDATSGASILWCWVTSGTCTPATAYTASIYVNPPTTVTVCANASASGYSSSSTVCHAYTNGGTQTTATPVITLASGTYAMPTSTTITDSTSGASILWCYITSGACTPATAYTASIYVNPSSTVTVCANASASGYSVSSTVCHAWTNGQSIVIPGPGIINTIGGTAFLSGNGGPATGAGLNMPSGSAVDSSGNLYFADSNNGIVQKVTTSTGVISTVAGNGITGFGGDAGLATMAELNSPSAVAVDASGNIYIAEWGNCRIRKVTLSTGAITTIAGSGVCGYSGDGVAATGAEINGPYGVALDSAGNIYIADSGNNRIRKVLASSGIISTLGGNGTSG